MTLEQLSIEIKQLIIDGKGKCPVYFKDGHASLPVSRVMTDKLSTVDVVVLKY